MTFDYNDAPISAPEEDAFGVNDFAKTLAKSLYALKAPRGSVLSLNGVWGSGKSSSVNLILHHLAKLDAREEIKVVRFECWWFRGEEALALAFFRELHAVLGPSLGKKAKEAISKIGSRLLKISPVVGPLVDVITGGLGGAIGTGALQSLAGLIEDDQNIEALHRDLAAALAKQGKRFLIVIDDLDRLAPDEMLLMFRLVKSAGRLPKVMYLMVYDRVLAEKVVAETYPAEGPHFLEKIVQASFELPAPTNAELRLQALSTIQSICEPLDDQDETVEILNAFHDVTTPLLRTPRDVKRLGYNLSVTWPTVRGEVAIGDYVAIESLRLFRQPLYVAIRAHQDLLAGVSESTWSSRADDLAAKYDAAFLRDMTEGDKDFVRTALKRLFPRTLAVWGNMHYSHDSLDRWRLERRICSPEYFETYFRFSIGPDTLSHSEIEKLLSDAAENPSTVADALLAGVALKRRTRGTRAALILDELHLHADRIADTTVGPLLAAIFGVVDDIDIEADEAPPFEIGNNPLRVHWLARRLTQRRFDLRKRSRVFADACKRASLAWLVDFTTSAYRDYHPREGKQPEPEENCLTTPGDADRLRKRALKAVIEASRTGSLIRNKRLAYLLFRWKDMAGEGSVTARKWATSALRKPENVLAFMRAFRSYTWIHSGGFDEMGDRVSKRNLRANIGSIDEVLDKARFRASLERRCDDDGLSKAEREEIREFLASWDRVESGDDP